MNFKQLDSTIKNYKDKPGSLILVLQKAQEMFGYLPPELLAYIAKKMQVGLAKVEGVASFYTQFRLKPVGKHVIMLCQGTACHVNGSGGLFDALSKHLGVADGETTKDGYFTLTNVACLGCCSLAPAMMIGDKTYGNLDNKTAIEIIDGIENGELRMENECLKSEDDIVSKNKDNNSQFSTLNSQLNKGGVQK